MTNISQEELQALVQRIMDSGILGRSQTYAAILNYLVKCSKEGTSPKEIAIAMDVLGRDTNFDVAKDSIVRVHFYHLRNKLKSYYEKFGKNEKYIIEIPKGQYIITAILTDEVKQQDELGETAGLAPAKLWIAGLALLLFGLNIFQFFNKPAVSDFSYQPNPYREVGPWQAMLDDETPVVIVIGDYYIFGELDESGGVDRMVREFNINSSEDLEFEQSLSEDAVDYFNLDLSYIPTSSAFALAKIMPVFANDAERVKIKMMSELTTADLVGNHIIYLGYLSGLGSLHDLMFAASDLSVGATYDELFNLETDEYYYSSSGLSIGENSFKDYGMVTTFPSPSGNQFVMIAGMRDEGLINVSLEATNIVEVERLVSDIGGGEANVYAYEALYEVFGYDGTNFDANRVYSKSLSTDIIWEARLIGNQER